ncbi:MAG: class I SAM-dependent methyltransferase [Acidimicrobiales bacterium]|nr:class I SAM-dependent methyltransferase [Acidimicrobiales bacterium]
MSDDDRRRLAVRVTPDALRQIRGGHPWVYDASITSVSHAGDAGDLAVVFDDKRRFAAIGLWDPHSPIRIKILHVGSPTTIDADWLRRRIAAAIGRRASLATSGHTTGYRLVHGENDGLPGLVVDRYDTALVVKLYSAAWFAHLDAVVVALATELGPECVVLRLARSVAPQAPDGLGDGATVLGAEPTTPQLFTEHGLVFEADLVRGQKTGHFLDQRDNRALVRSLAEGARVLDVFCCTGGFTVHAAAGGAESVLAVDLAVPALATLRRNLAHNGDHPAVERCAVTTQAGDAFDAMAALAAEGRRFDIVVVDPPSFAGKRADVERALRSYARLTELALPLVASGGVLLQASCSSRVSAEDFFASVHSVAARSAVRLDELARTGHALDHPVGFAQGEYLKAIVAQRR